MVGGTEAFAFGIEETDWDPNFDVVVHIRPGNSDPDVIERAREAFIEIATPCVKQRRNGAIEIVTRGKVGEQKQFCLVVLLYEKAGTGDPKGVVGVIAPCRDQSDARGKLNVLAGWAPRTDG